MKKEMSSHLVNSYRGESFILYPITVKGDNKVIPKPKYEDERVYISSR